MFATLHTTGAAGTINRIIDAFPVNQQAQVRVQLSVALICVLSQVLLTRMDRPGRIAAFEFLVVTPAISNLIREGKTFQIPSLMQTGKKQGMTLLNDALFELVKNKSVAPEEAYQKAVDKAGFLSLLTSAGINLQVKSEVD